MKKRPVPSPAFTLIELLTVIAVIAILASLILATTGYVQDKAARSRAQGEIAAITTALESYKADNGDYPAGTNNITSSMGNNLFLVQALSPTNGKVYMELNKSRTNSYGYLTDPWGNSYGYAYPGTNSGSNFFDVWSTANKTNNTNGWIKNW